MPGDAARPDERGRRDRYCAGRAPRRCRVRGAPAPAGGSLSSSGGRPTCSSARFDVVAGGQRDSRCGRDDPRGTDGPGDGREHGQQVVELGPGHLGRVDGAPEGRRWGVERDQHADPHQGLGPWVEVMDARLADPRVGHRRDERRVAQRQATECRSGGWARAAAHRRPPVVLPCAWTAPFKPGAGRLASSRWGDARPRGRLRRPTPVARTNARRPGDRGSGREDLGRPQRRPIPLGVGPARGVNPVRRWAPPRRRRPRRP